MSRKDKKKNINGKGPNALWLLIAGLVVGMTYLFWYNSNHRDVIGLSYSTLLKQLDENKVSTIAIQVLQKSVPHLRKTLAASNNPHGYHPAQTNADLAHTT